MNKTNSIKIDTNFCLSEFQCPCCAHVIIHSDLLKLLVKLRNLVREPIYINSGFRCIKENKKVSGVDKSYHLFGMAADISLRSKRLMDIAEFAHSVGFKGIGVYKNFLHLDVREYQSHWEG